MKLKDLIFFGGLTLLFFSCQSPEPQKQYTGDEQFHTTDPSRLYFNNIRSTQYYRQRKPNTKIDTYRHRKLSFVNDRPILHPMIVNNWLEDEAYIFIEKNDFEKGWSDTLTIQWAVEDSIGGYFYLDVPTRPKMFEFSGYIYEAMREGKKLAAKDREGNFHEILEESKDRQAFFATMRDFYRLTEVF